MGIFFTRRINFHDALSSNKSVIRHNEMSDNELRRKIKSKEIGVGGNRGLKIYGTLSCHFGIKMRRENRVFFNSENEAVEKGYRPCGHCMKEQYQKWKNGFV